jgi:hypothetical protein
MMVPVRVLIGRMGAVYELSCKKEKAAIDIVEKPEVRPGRKAAKCFKSVCSAMARGVGRPVGVDRFECELIARHALTILARSHAPRYQASPSDALSQGLACFSVHRRSLPGLTKNSAPAKNATLFARMPLLRAFLEIRDVLLQTLQERLGVANLARERDEHLASLGLSGE